MPYAFLIVPGLHAHTSFPAGKKAGATPSLVIIQLALRSLSGLLSEPGEGRRASRPWNGLREKSPSIITPFENAILARLDKRNFQIFF
jgi:hypothetical protein